jgi:hypothetical protein|tara:strand:+ start:5779 stop:6033 length:255 start_codon:yes stop_codon:yes gene_type:complete
MSLNKRRWRPNPRQEFAKKMAIEYKLPRAERYDIVKREFDNSVEVIGYVQDPTKNMNDFRGREMLFPKRWVTLGVFQQTSQMPV